MEALGALLHLLPHQQTLEHHGKNPGDALPSLKTDRWRSTRHFPEGRLWCSMHESSHQLKAR